MADFGFVRVAAASPRLRVADPCYNVREMRELVFQAEAEAAAILIFPELSITGYTCGDLFGQKLLLQRAVEYLLKLASDTKDTQVLSVVGLPLEVEQKLYNCAAVIHRGKILGIVPKMYPANYKEFYENRWFTSGHAISQSVTEVTIEGLKVPFGNLIFKSGEPNFSLGIEICEDLWTVIPVSSYLALNGATVVANLSASNELVCKSDYRHQLVAQQSARCMCGYVYASSGVHESTTDLVFGGDCIIAENGSVLGTSKRFDRENVLIFSEVDIDRLSTERILTKTFAENYGFDAGNRKYRYVEVNYGQPFNLEKRGLKRQIAAQPFIPENPETRNQRCREIFNIQVAGLAKRMEHTGLQHAVIGVSGGLDSTLALLVTVKTFGLLGLPTAGIHALTMPGFGTTDITYSNAMKMIKSLQVTAKEISIEAACLQHFADIGHSAEKHDITFENTQARERTQILMDYANKVQGLVVGTGDLSELALGWATYNGDHMSMYAVNSSVPKTLVRFLVGWVAENQADMRIRKILNNILETPISPELLPPDSKGGIQQKTEDVIGPYELHDFFLYYGIRFGMPPEKVLFLARMAFAAKYNEEEIRKWLKYFYRRFFSQQFKRSALPDGPKVGTISLSPRGDWRMPSDAEADLWTANID